MKNQNWPDGSLRRVSRMSMSAIERARGFDFMSPEERLRAAQEHDRLTARTFRITPKAGETASAFERRLIAKRG